jgi:hypothetical protein
MDTITALILAAPFSCVGVGTSMPSCVSLPQTEQASVWVRDPARERAWVARCNPQIEIGLYGVKHYVYSAVNCEYGD